MSGTTRPNVRLACMLALWLCAVAVSAAEPVDVDAFVKRDRVSDIKLSPSGDYYAMTVQFEDRTALKILRRADKKVTGSFQLGEHHHVRQRVGKVGLVLAVVLPHRGRGGHAVAEQRLQLGDDGLVEFAGLVHRITSGDRRSF